ncbi:MAG: ABC transporter permease [Armatimonadetes bacterium]|nr:ABC transporter permease [Armatimonadota bacterium]
MREQSAPAAGAPPAVDRGETVLSRRPSFWRRLRRSRLAAGGLVVVTLVVLTALFAPWLSPFDPFKHDTTRLLEPPARPRIFGTDQYGRDVFSRVVWGSRFSLQVGASALVLGGVFGILIGLVSGYFGRAVDHILSRVIDTTMSFPSIIVAIAIVGVLRGGTQSIIIALGFAIMPRFARVVRSQVLTLKVRDYVDAARAVGAGHLRILARHLLPNSLSPIIVLATLYLPYAILVESSLSFLGIGVSPDTPTWGRIIADGREYLQVAPWVSTLPGIAITLTSIGFNLLGDGLRDILDPRLRV